MAAARTYFVRMPTVAATMPFLDILVQGPVGSAAAPVGAGTAPPAGWQVFGAVTGNGQFFEWRSKTLRLEQLALLPNGQPNPAFVPRLRLGWQIGLERLDAECNALPRVIYSQSLLGALPAAYSSGVIPDPTYGPVIRLVNNSEIEGAVLVAHLAVAEQRDETRTPGGA